MVCAACAEARRKLLEAALSRDLSAVGREALNGIRLLAEKVEADRKRKEDDGTDPAQ